MFDKGAFMHAVCDCFQGVLNGAMSIKRFPSSLALPFFGAFITEPCVRNCADAWASPPRLVSPRRQMSALT